jgi:hypothetical protein
LYRLIRSLSGFAPGSPEAAIREALLDTAGQCALLGESRRLAGFRLGLLLSSLPAARAPRVLAWYENQTVDKCLLRGLRQAEARSGCRLPVTGAQLFIWPDTLLNNHPDDGEAALGLAPDKVLVNGPFFLPEASSQNYALGPSLRYAHLFETDPDEPPVTDPGPRDRRTLLALLSYHPEETRRVLELAPPLARSGLDIVYRFHPATDPGDYAALLPEAPRLSSAPLSLALKAAGAVLGAGSGALAEAVALGLPVLAVAHPRPGLGLDYLPDFGKGELWESVSVPEDLEPALERLLAFARSSERPQRVRDFRGLLFTEPTPERIRQAFEP